MQEFILSKAYRDHHYRRIYPATGQFPVIWAGICFVNSNISYSGAIESTHRTVDRKGGLGKTTI
jgi:hypothetical protein